MLKLDDYITGMYDAKAVELPTGTKTSISNVIQPTQQTTGVSQNKTNTSNTGDTTKRMFDNSTLFGFGLNNVIDFWSLLAGTGQNKLDALANQFEQNPFIGKEYADIITDLNKQYADQIKDWKTQQYLTTGITQPQPIDFKFPDILGGLKDVGKWVLIGGGVLAGVWLLGKYIGRSKK